ncbi:MAG: hypothetical protein U0457_04685 [Candidatus Sericytochromatia bacterium]
MAVAAMIGGAVPNFDPLYQEVTRLSRKLSAPSPREFNDPGQSLQLTVTPLDAPAGNVVATVPPQKFDLFIRPYYDKEKDQQTYMLYFKDPNGAEQRVCNGLLTNGLPGFNNFFNVTGVAGVRYTLNGQVLNNAGNETLALDPLNGRIIFNTAAGYNPASTTNIPVGLMKLDAVNGLDLGLINDRISSTNLTIEALNKVLIAANNNVDKSIELRL